MNRRRRFLGAGLVLAGLLAGGMHIAAAADAPTIALVKINQQALFFNQINEGAKKPAKAAGVKLVIFNANNEPAAQNNAIENYIAQKVDGIVVVAIDVNGIMPAVAGGGQGRHPGGRRRRRSCRRRPQLAQVGVDNEAAGELIGKYFVKYVNEQMGGKAKLGIVGALNSFIQNQRQNGFEKAVTTRHRASHRRHRRRPEHPGQRLAAAENLMTANPDMTAIYATGEPALLGAVAAVDEPGPPGNVKVVRLGPHRRGDQGHRRRLCRRRRPAGSGRQGCGRRRRADEAIKSGEKVPAKIDVPVTIVTKDNVEPVPRHVQDSAARPMPRRTRCCRRHVRASADARASASASARSRRCVGSTSSCGPARCWGWSATTPPASRR